MIIEEVRRCIAYESIQQAIDIFESKVKERLATEKKSTYLNQTLNTLALFKARDKDLFQEDLKGVLNPEALSKSRNELRENILRLATEFSARYENSSERPDSFSVNNNHTFSKRFNAQNNGAHLVSNLKEAFINKISKGDFNGSTKPLRTIKMLLKQLRKGDADEKN